VRADSALGTLAGVVPEKDGKSLITPLGKTGCLCSAPPLFPLTEAICGLRGPWLVDSITLRLTLDTSGGAERRPLWRCYAAPDSSDDPLATSTILPVTPPFPSNSCACLASARGNRRAISGLIFCC
jgi:hypothetical protein